MHGHIGRIYVNFVHFSDFTVIINCTFVHENFAAIAKLLTQCLRIGVALECTVNRQEAFDRLKSALTDAAILGVARDDMACHWVVDSDASSHAAGAVLQQWQDGKLRVTEYACRVFNRAEWNF